MSAFVDPALVPKRRLSTGEMIPCIGMGTFGSDRFSPRQVADAVAGAIRCGWRMLDCASVYGNEAQIGEVLAEAFGEGAVARKEMFITSKVWNDRHKDVRAALLKSLSDLRLESIDVYFLHWPFPNYHAPGCDGDARNPDSVPFETERYMDTWRQMEQLYDEGLIRNLGMSNMTIPKLEAVLPLCRVQPTMIEMELHPAFQQEELFAYCVDKGILPVGYCPIGSPARPERDKTAADVVDTELPEVQSVAAAHGIHPAIVCLKWAVQRGQVPIPFSVSAGHIAENLRCTTEDPLTEAEMELLKSAERDCRLVKGQVFLWPSAGGWEDLWDIGGTITR